MSDKDFNIEDIINGVNSKTHNDKTNDIVGDITFEKKVDNNDAAASISDKLLQDANTPALIDASDIASLENDSFKAIEDELNESDEVVFDGKQSDEKAGVTASADEKAEPAEVIRPTDEKENSAIPVNNEVAGASVEIGKPAKKPAPKKEEYIKKPTNNTKKKKKKSKVNNSIFGGLILIVIILTVSLVLAVTGINVGMEYMGIGKNENYVTFNIPEGSTTEDIVNLLEQNNIIESPKLFEMFLKFKNPASISQVILHFNHQ